MDNAGPGFASNARQRIAAMSQQGVDQSAFLVARRRMHYHALRLVYDNDILIFIDDIQRNLLGLR